MVTSDPAQWDGHRIAVRFSAGVANCREDDFDEFSPKKRKDEEYYLTAKISNIKVKDEKIYFQVFTFINKDVCKKDLKTIQTVEMIIPSE